MEWLQLLIISVEIGALWLWQRSESREEFRNTQRILESQRDLIDQIRLDMKDFHYRLLEIERNRK